MAVGLPKFNHKGSCLPIAYSVFSSLMGKKEQTTPGEYLSGPLSFVQVCLTMQLEGRGLPCDKLLVYSWFTYFERVLCS